MTGTAGAAFLDRDGTINVKAPEGDYITCPDRLVLLPGAAAAIRALNDASVLTIVVTNQRGVALERMASDDLDSVHHRLAELLERDAGARLDAILSCPHDKGVCDCRKPGVGLFEQARIRFPEIDLSASVMIGDSVSDVDAASAAGMRSILIGVDEVDLAAAVRRVL